MDQLNSVRYDFTIIYPRKTCLSPSNLRCLDTYMWSNKGPKAGNTTDLKYVYYLILKTQITDEPWIAIKGVIECPEQSSFWEMFYTAYICLIIYSRTYKILGDIQKCNIDHSEHIQETNIVLLVVLPENMLSLGRQTYPFTCIGQSVPKASTGKKVLGTVGYISEFLNF